jgi:hypothetical protein
MRLIALSLFVCVIAAVFIADTEQWAYEMEDHWGNGPPQPAYEKQLRGGSRKCKCPATGHSMKCKKCPHDGGDQVVPTLQG